MAERFLEEFKGFFIDTARGRIAELTKALLALEKNPKARELIETIFQNAHSLKGESAMMGYTNMAYLCHVIEDIFAAIREGKLSFSSKFASALFRSLDSIEAALSDLAQNKAEPEFTKLIADLKRLTGVTTQKNVLKTPRKTPAAQKKEPRKLPVEQQLSEKSTKVTVALATFDEIMNLVEQILVERMKLEAFITAGRTEAAIPLVKEQGRLLAELQFRVMKARMIPLRFVTEQFPRLVRDAALAEKKNVTLVIRGEETPLDRSVVDHLTEPLVHILRNAVSHGIEAPAQRKKLGKPETGTIAIEASRVREFVVITVEDDGAGLDLEALKREAAASGLVDRQAVAALRPTELYGLLLRGGLSTASRVTELSGRGVGMAVVKKVIDSLGGDITVESTPGLFTRFTLRLPLTVAIVRVLIVRVGEQFYGIPVSLIDRTITITPGTLKTVAERPMVVIEEEDVPVLSIKAVFHVQSEPSSKEPDAVVVRWGLERVAFVVDELIGEDEVVLKPLARALSSNPFFSGATVLGNGKPALILDTAGIIEEERRRGEPGTAPRG